MAVKDLLEPLLGDAELEDDDEPQAASRLEAPAAVMAAPAKPRNPRRDV
jgi:hypothetical protein